MTSVNQAQKDSIHGLGRGGNIPLGATKKFTESNDEYEDLDPNVDDVGEQGRGFQRGRGRRGGGRNINRRDLAMKKTLTWADSLLRYTD